MLDAYACWERQWVLPFHELENLFRRDEQMETEESLLKCIFEKMCVAFCFVSEIDAY